MLGELPEKNQDQAAKAVLFELLIERYMEAQLRGTVGERLGKIYRNGDIDRLIAIANNRRYDMAVRVDAGWALNIDGEDSGRVVNSLCSLVRESSSRYGYPYTALRNVCLRFGVDAYPDRVGWPSIRYE